MEAVVEEVWTMWCRTDGGVVDCHFYNIYGVKPVYAFVMGELQDLFYCLVRSLGLTVGLGPIGCGRFMFDE